MKVMFVSHLSNLYGATMSLLYLVEDLRNRYNVTTVVLVPSKGKLTDELDKRNIEYIECKYYWWMANIKNKNIFTDIAKDILNRIFNYKAIIRIKEERIDLVHSNTSVCDVGYDIARNKNIPHVWHIREHGREDSSIDYINSKKYVKRKYINTNRIICVSNSVKDKYKNIVSNNNNIVTLYNGVAFDKEYEKKFNLYNKTLNLCIVGSIGDNKNQLEAIKAIKLLIDKQQCNLLLNIIGDGNQEYQQKLDNYINENQLNKYVKFWGYRNDISKLLEQMDIGIMCSKNEAFGRVTVEYMSKCIPVIGANTGGTKEILEDTNTGLLYEVGNSNDLASKILYFIENPYEIKRIGINAHDSAVNNFHIQTNTDKIYIIYNEIVNEGK